MELDLGENRKTADRVRAEEIITGNKGEKNAEAETERITVPVKYDRKNNAMEQNSRKFRLKSFITFTVSWIFIILAFTGVIIFFTPAGRIAYWNNWTFWGLSKDDWQGMHIIFSALFILFIVLHLIFNWRVMLSYLRSKAASGLYLKREFAISTIIIGVFVFASVFSWSPVWFLMDWRQQIKHDESAVTVQPPASHTEEMTIEDIAKMIDIPVQTIIENVRAAGMNIDENKTLAALAEDNSMTPAQLYDILIGKDAEHAQAMAEKLRPGLGRIAPEKRSEYLDEDHKRDERSSGGSPGYGRKTVRHICRESGVPVETALANLRARGISANSGDHIKELSARLGCKPADIIRYIEGK